MGGAKREDIVNESKRVITRRSRSARISFSAKLPSDVSGVWADQTICAVLTSVNPLLDLKQSILEMVRVFGVSDWDDLEELLYCYIALNSSDVHSFILDAFLTLFT